MSSFYISFFVLASPAGLEAAVPLRLRYAAVADAELEAGCGYGWSALSDGRCAAAVAAADADQRLSWPRAQQRCRDLRGHLVSVASAAAQLRLDRLLRATHSEDADVAYWIGATDRTLEGDFHWSDGQPFQYSNWFPQQPNDDALAEQNCVEVRRSLAGHRDRSFRWNDRSCTVRNAFVCQRRRDTPKQQPGGADTEAASASASASCRRSVRLSREAPRATASSPGFPRHYPDNADCFVDVAAPDGYRIVVDFEELVLEDEPTCSYDYLQILEPVGNSNSSVATRRLCGDWSSRLKKLRYVSQGPALQLRFFSDYSHHYSGYKARISMEQGMKCADERLQVFNSSCYLFVSYPQVSWQTARQTCQDRKAELASIGSPEEQSFVTASIRNSPEYSTAAVYWLGGRAVPAASPARGRGAWLWAWADGTPISYSGWLRDQEHTPQSGACLGLQWVSSPNPQVPSGLYWQQQRCSAVGGYVCKRSNQVTEGGVQLNRTVNGTEGFLTSPNFPGGYGPNLDYWVRLAGPAGSRLVLRFTRLDLEPQQDCLYDYIELRSLLPQPATGDDDADADAERAPDSRVVRCGRHDDADLHRLNFVSESNEALLHFHSDYSVSGGGFSASWQAVDVSGCPLQTLTAREGRLTSPNYPHFLLAHLDCATTILAPAGRRVWLEFSEFSIGAGEALLEVDLGGGQAAFQPFQSPTHLTDGVFLSVGERLQVRLRTADRPSGAGFSAVYRTVGAALERRVLRLASGAVGSLLHLNWPRPPPPHVDLATLLVAPPAHTILLELHHVALALAPTPAADAAAPASGTADAATPSCPDGAGILEVRDSYADSNGTAWLLCEAQNVPPLAIASYLNTLTVRQRGSDRGVTLNATVRVQPDANYKLKLLRGSEDGSVESCNPSPCLNGGRCLSSGNRHSCQCTSHYTGMFCALTLCELEPCLHGQCRLTETGYACHCQPGFTGATCDRKQRACADNPCEGRGECLERGDAFHCRCHAWWEGQRCERRMMHIPFKPLSERMLQEPFWLGLITVTVVLLLIGLVWCAKRHFPEKLEKLLAEEADRSRSVHSRPPSVRDHLAGAGAAAVVVVPSPQPGCPRSLLGRLGIRKPSLLSLTSPHGYNSHPSAATARTFSLDDLLKPPPRRTPSPRKKRNNSTPTKKNAAEKKQILQQLINQQPSRKVSIGELIQLSERKAQEQQLQQHAGAREAETAFGSAEGTPDSGAIMDAKLEKKVTFARLLSKVSAEMSSGGSDGEVVSRPAQLSGLMSAAASGSNGASGAAAASLPRSASSPHSTSSTQGSDSVSSAEVSRRRASGPAATGAPPSADAILAMFRTFARAPTPSTASSPQDDDDDASSTTSSVPSSSLTVESPPPSMRNTIEVPVLDALSPHRGSSNLLHPPSILLELPAKCLSPITEMPTPVPTPIMSRHGSCAALPAITLTPNEHDDTERGNWSVVNDTCACLPQQLAPPTAQWQSTNTRLSVCQQSRQSSGGRTSPAAAAAAAAVAPANPAQRRQMLKELDKPASLDLPCPPPIITVTCNLSEPDSDDDDDDDDEDDDVGAGARRRRPASAASAGGGGGGGPSGLAPAVAPSMCYLSPFSMCSRADRTASESNLSSSGYSSMASPGPSRCGSNNPLCPSETDEPPPSGPGGPAPPSSGQTSARRAAPLLLLPPAGSQAPPTTQLRHLHTQHDAAALVLSPDADAGGDGTPPAGASGTAPTAAAGAAAGTCTSAGGGNGTATGAGGGASPAEAGCPRARSDSETLSDDIFLESNDEGIGTDHIDEKIEEGELKSAKELEVFIGKELVESGKTLLGLSASRSSLQLPSIVVHGQEQSPSPVSSRSDSPLSEKAANSLALGLVGSGIARLTRGDSDGLYECATAGAHASELRPRRSGGRRHRHRSGAQPGCSTSPAQPLAQPLPSLPPRAKSPLPELLDVPLRERRKQSPKRARTRVSQLPASTSSSSESLDSAREMTLRLSSSEKALCPERHCWSGGSFDEGRRLSIEASGEDTGEDVMSQMLPKTLLRGEDLPKSSKKISRLRTIGHQIRFLRRLEQSLKRRECLVSPSDSLDEEEPPLLHKSSSYGQLQASGHGHHRNRRLRRQGGLLVPQLRVTSASGGHSN
ncbi:uncharacterized protein LOC126252230 [Schistocerca nitens]|uniref:uncharacterized protein LOC126252230 n=1 Tax=Schistocerca nitens TaxID=7011 RepID=UPI002118C493|nr:uncharacterized protein LOC126252230 [Schistocerca nitens]